MCTTPVMSTASCIHPRASSVHPLRTPSPTSTTSPSSTPALPGPTSPAQFVANTERHVHLLHGHPPGPGVLCKQKLAHANLAPTA
uniref:Uncharacterized protein n=1 Tax=Aegilops tauschii subsp. strangulata TaxID=200361 RepID=A0A453Q6S0_AEGTS